MKRDKTDGLNKRQQEIQFYSIYFIIHSFITIANNAN